MLISFCYQRKVGLTIGYLIDDLESIISGYREYFESRGLDSVRSYEEIQIFHHPSVHFC